MQSFEINIRHVATLCRIALAPEEEELFGKQLEQILGYFEKLKQANVDGLDPMAHAVELYNVTRPDVVKESLPTDLAMMNAPSKHNGLFIVPKIVE